MGRRKRSAPWLIAGIGVGLSLLVAGYLAWNAGDEARLRTQSELKGYGQALQLLLEEKTQMVEMLGQLFSVNPETSYAQFAVTTKKLRKTSPSMLATGWVPRVEPGAWSAILRRAAEHGLDDFRRKGPDGPVGLSLSVSYPVLYVAPRESNEAVLGVDVALFPERLRILETARDTGRVQSSSALPLIQDQDTLGVILYAPVYSTPEPPASEMERRKAFLGVVTTAFRIDYLVEHLSLPYLQLYLVDPVAEPGRRVLYRSAGLPARGAADLLKTETLLRRELNWGDHTWVILTPQESPSYLLPIVILVGGLFLTALLVLGFRLQALRSEQAEIRAQEFAELNQRLEQSLEEKQTLLREINHRVRNSLALAASLLSLEKRAGSNAADQIGRAQERIMAIARLHEHLYVSDSYDRVDLDAYARTLCQELDPDGSSIRYEGTRVDISRDQAVTIGLILSELVINGLKHRGEGAAVAVSIRNEADVTLIEVSNKYSGEKPEGRDTGVGSILLEQFARQLDATVDIQASEEDYRVKLTLPKASLD